MFFEITVFRTVILNVFAGGFALLCLSDANAAILIEDTNFAVSTSEFPPEAFSAGFAKTFDVDIFKADGINPGEVSTTILGVSESESPGSARITNADEVLNASSIWYIGERNQVFSAETIADGVQEPWGDDIGTRFTLDVPYDQDIWFGVNTGIGFEENETGQLVPRRDIFGWIQLQVDTDLNVSLVDNAMAFDSGQIVIGRNLVPEPCANLWAFVAALGLLARQRRRRVGA